MFEIANVKKFRLEFCLNFFASQKKCSKAYQDFLNKSSWCLNFAFIVAHVQGVNTKKICITGKYKIHEGLCEREFHARSADYVVAYPRKNSSGNVREEGGKKKCNAAARDALAHIRRE